LKCARRAARLRLRAHPAEPAAELERIRA